MKTDCYITFCAQLLLKLIFKLGRNTDVLIISFLVVKNLNSK